MTRRWRAPGIDGAVEIVRDRYGIPHVAATSRTDAFFAMGVACAQDRLFQMDYDRRRALGRLAEVAGPSVLAADLLARRLGLRSAALADVAAMSPETKAIFEAYAAGVNWALEQGTRPYECTLVDFDIEPWEPWHSVAVFKIRHVLMGVWQHKLALATVLARSDPRAFGQLLESPPPGSPVTAPSGARLQRLMALATDEVAEVAAYLGFLSEAEAGSNAWAVSGSRTTHGAAVLCNDSHRALDAPNVYWQCHLAGPDFAVIGATFAGFPGFTHFGHNGKVAWAITHVGADTQDLYVERFDTEQPGRYATPDGWATASRRVETLSVRGASTVKAELWATDHGPVVHGDVHDGTALSMRYTATDRAARGYECILPMMDASSVEELLDAQRDWVDPVNNLVAADFTGSIGYQTRGELPLRSPHPSRGVPAPGWTGACEWVSRVAFTSMPRELDPPNGFIMTANNTVTGSEDPYIASTFTDPFRAERLCRLLEGTRRHTGAGLASMQADVTSLPAEAFARLCRQMAPLGAADSPAEQARSMLASFDGRLQAGSAAALVYGCLRRALAEFRYAPLIGEDTWRWTASESIPSSSTVIRRWFGNDIWALAGGPVPPDDPAGAGARSEAMRSLLPQALARAYEDARRMGGNDPSKWRWGDHHRVEPRHVLSGAVDDGHLPHLPLQPPAVAMGGDGDTIQAASYGWTRGTPFSVTSLSVYRQVVDFHDLATAGFVIPGGASGDPRSPHFADQLAEWVVHRRVPMLTDLGRVREQAEATTTILP